MPDESGGLPAAPINIGNFVTADLAQSAREERKLSICVFGRSQHMEFSNA
jgi:hypothetical protein